MLLLFLVFVLLVATVCCLWRRAINSKKYAPGEIHAPLEIPPEKVEIPMQEHKHEENFYTAVPFKNSEPL